MKFKEEYMSKDVVDLNKQITLETVYTEGDDLIKEVIEGYKKYQKILEILNNSRNNQTIPFNERVIYQKIYDLLQE
jgi:hypothetical protein